MNKERKNRMSDEYFMELVAKGDLDKLSVLFKKYHLNLYNFFLRRRHTEDVCEDLTQNVFERIIKYRNSYKASHPFRAWIFRIARNVEADYYNQQKNISLELHNSEPITINILHEIEKREQKVKIQQALSMLSAEEQELLHFSKYQKLRGSEIAEIMELTESAVRVKIHRAMKILKANYFKIEVL